MTTKEITNGLRQLGYESGWVVSGEQITVWENAENQPTIEEIKEAAKLYVEPEISVNDKLASVGLNIDNLKEALGLQ